jgi:two-component system chemotaxis response regulator CheB
MRVIVVDDSTIFRKVVRDSLASIPGVEVVGVAGDGKTALAKIQALKPDLVTLDIEMPELDGLQVLQQLADMDDRPQVIMLSALTASGAKATTQSLQLGAFEFVLKPAGPSLEESQQQLERDLRPKIQALMATAAKPSLPALKGIAKTDLQPATNLTPAADIFKRPAQVIGIGVSTGGPAALMKLLPRLPKDFAAPILIVQHMPPMFTKSLAEDLNKSCELNVVEASEGQQIDSGTVYIAPGGKQMKVGRLNGRYFTSITDDPPEGNCKPAVDYLFRSLAHNYHNSAAAVVMTGMGEDGLIGCRLLKRHGCPILTQDAASCVVYGMPRQIVEAGLADVIAPLESLHESILKATHQEEFACH